MYHSQTSALNVGRRNNISTGMLKSIHIHNYRSCVDVRLSELGAITALLGRNGAGKTNVLKAIEWVARLLSTFSVPSGSDVLAFDTGHITVEFAGREGRSFTYRVDKRIDYDYRNGEPKQKVYFEEDLYEIIPGSVKHLFSRQGEKVILYGSGQEIEVSLGTSAVISLFSVLPDSDPLKGLTANIIGVFGGISYFSASHSEGATASTVVDGDMVKKWEGRVWKNWDTGADTTILRILDLWINDKDTFSELIGILGDSGLQLISDIDVMSFGGPTHIADAAKTDDTSQFYFVRFKPVGNVSFFTFKDLSFGTQRIVRLVTSILVDKASMLLVEQPEDGIHPALLHKLIPQFRVYCEGMQIILASHAPAIMDRLLPDEIRLVEIANGRTHLRALSPDEIWAANQYLAEEGPLSDFVESL